MHLRSASEATAKPATLIVADRRIASPQLIPRIDRCLTEFVTGTGNNEGGTNVEDGLGAGTAGTGEALRTRYRAGSRAEKTRNLQEFASISGYHRKSAIRILNGSCELCEPSLERHRPRLYDEAVRQALIVLWEASDRVCGKRLKALLPVLLPALERHEHLPVDPAIRPSSPPSVPQPSIGCCEKSARQALEAAPGGRRRRCAEAYRSGRLLIGTTLHRGTWKWIWSPTPERLRPAATCTP